MEGFIKMFMGGKEDMSYSLKKQHMIMMLKYFTEYSFIEKI